MEFEVTGDYVEGCLQITLSTPIHAVTKKGIDLVKLEQLRKYSRLIDILWGYFFRSDLSSDATLLCTKLCFQLMIYWPLA